MTTLQELLQSQPLPGHCFRPQHYIRPDIHSGLLYSRGGYRLAAFPILLIQAIYSGLRYETGQATPMILFNCGRQWGEVFWQRFQQEMQDYYQQPIWDLPMGILLDCLSDLWATHGWGRLRLDLSHGDRGVIIAEVTASGFAAAAKANLGETPSPEPMGYLEAGVLACVFSRLAGRELGCVQTACETMGSPVNLFVITIPERLQGIPEQVKRGVSHAEIMDGLLK
ncbi:MAG: V4R domain-containing protein [Thermostichales cyanobacterium SZTDM-1c_bins_54]